MKYKFVLLLLVIFLLPVAMHGQGNGKPLNYSQFYKKDTTAIHKGYYSVYVSNGKYYLEIPTAAFDKELLMTIHVSGGMSAFVSPASGVIRFSEGRNNTLDIYKHLTRDVASDSTESAMNLSLEKSGFIPVFYTLPVFAHGEDGKSIIVDITGELGNPSGLFAVSANSALNHPDPARSGIDTCKIIDKGVVFTVHRTQTDYRQNPQTRIGFDEISSFKLDILLQELPERQFSDVEAHPAYGFETVTKNIYDTRQFLVQKKDFIQHWNLLKKSTDKITVYIDTVTPPPFRQSILNALSQWETAFKKAGYNQVFDITSDRDKALLRYKTIMFKWGSAYANVLSTNISHPVTGEILCAKVNVTDATADEMLQKYLLQCGLIDKRALKNMENLSIRQDIMTAFIASKIGKVLGLKENYAGYTVFSVEDLRSEAKLKKYGISASITPPVGFNYVARPGDKIKPANLLPVVSIYDQEAIDYAYGTRKSPPSLKASYFTTKKGDPFSQPTYLSNDLLKSAQLGIDNLKDIYPDLEKIVRQQPYPENKWSNVGMLTAKLMILYSDYLKQVASLVGGKSSRAVVNGYKDSPTTFVEGDLQRNALAFLESEILTQPSTWWDYKNNLKSCGLSSESFLIQTSNDVLKMIIKPEVLGALVEAEDLKVKDAMTCEELFRYIDRVVFHDFTDATLLTPYQRSIQLNFIIALAETASKNNVTAGLSDSINALHSYLYRVSVRVDTLLKSAKTSEGKEFYELMMLRLKRLYYNN
ncbi:MAG: DUF5118 domain-containing protein [Bacteroidales bacterium]|nr:DUF5118 domain-containing protein [Bacteroidales bacterium]